MFTGQIAVAKTCPLFSTFSLGEVRETAETSDDVLYRFNFNHVTGEVQGMVFTHHKGKQYRCYRGRSVKTDRFA